MISLIILNRSIGDSFPESQPTESLIERNLLASLIEQLAEEILSFKDIFNETRNSDLDSGNAISLIEENDLPSFPVGQIFVFKSLKISLTKVLIYKETYTEQFHPELSPPPPKS